jgi:hypothetical protein
MPQLTNEIDFSKYKRFFAFGCSFTEYAWYTWADIIGAKFKAKYQNWGQIGAGNLFIASSVAEAHARYNFTESDLVVCMWSSVTREDRYRNNRWKTGGNVYTSGTMSAERSFIKNWADDRFYLLRDLAQISLTRHLLESSQCSWDFLSIMPLASKEYNAGSIADTDIPYVYQKELQTIKPSVFDLLYNNKWENTVGINNDIHPTPLQHKRYLEKIYPNTDFSFSDAELTEEEDKWRSGVYNFDNRRVKRVPFNRL